MKNLRKLVVSIVLLLPLVGCAFGTDYVKINKYAPVESSDKGKGVVVYVAKMEDNRPQPEYLGQKAGGYIALEKGLNLSDILTRNVVSSLENAGYTVKYGEGSIPEGQPVLHPSLEELWTTFVQGFWTVDANTKARMDFELTEGDRTLWKKKIGKGHTESAVAAPPGLFEDSLNAALSDVMKELESGVSSDEFKNAVLKGTLLSQPK